MNAKNTSKNMYEIAQNLDSILIIEAKIKHTFEVQQ
jgi:hypothetical protein